MSATLFLLRIEHPSGHVQVISYPSPFYRALEMIVLSAQSSLVLRMIDGDGA